MNKLINDDCLNAMKQMEDNSVDSIVTDPPYGLSFMGKKWDYDVPSVEVWKEAMRVLKPGGHLLSFAGSRTYHRMAVNIEDAGFEIRDQIMWVYGSGFPKSHNIGKKLEDWEGWGTALKPAHEPIVVARKPISEKTIAKNVLKWGTGGINIDQCRVPAEQGEYDVRHYTKEDCFQNKAPKKSKFQVKPQPDGRFPANFIHDGSDEVLELFPETKSGKMTGRQGGFGNSELVFGANSKTPEAISFADKGSAARFFYVAKASKKDRDEGLPEGQTSTHPTVKPTKLMQYLVRLVTPKGGTVLDPFMGSGSTGKACKIENFDFIGIELDSEYFEIAKQRINGTD